jgi:hypothetical protein
MKEIEAQRVSRSVSRAPLAARSGASDMADAKADALARMSEQSQAMERLQLRVTELEVQLRALQAVRASRASLAAAVFTFISSTQPIDGNVLGEATAAQLAAQLQAKVFAAGEARARGAMLSPCVRARHTRRLWCSSKSSARNKTLCTSWASWSSCSPRKGSNSPRPRLRVSLLRERVLSSAVVFMTAHVRDS